MRVDNGRFKYDDVPKSGSQKILRNSFFARDQPALMGGSLELNELLV